MKVLYKFGPFFIDPQSKLLIKENKPVQIKPKVFDTLLVLVEGRGNVLTKDDLMEKIWSDTAVEENNLQQNISVLRKVLGETAEGTQYIETLPKRGYRFAATIEEIADDDALVVEKHTRQRIIIDQPPLLNDEKPVTPQTDLSLSQSTMVLPAVRRRTRVLQWTLTAGTVMALILAVGVLVVRRNLLKAHSPQSERKFVLKQTKTFGLKDDGEGLSLTDGKLSPDGKMIAYSAVSGDQSKNILVKVLDTDYLQALTKEAGENWCPLWSADGSEVAFLSDRGGQLGLWKVHHLGGAATLIYNFTPPTASAARSKPGLQSWSVDGRTIYYDWDENFYALDIAAKEITQLTSFDPEKLLIRDFQLSPDREWISYINRKENQSDIWMIPATGGAPVQITNDPHEKQHPVWSADGKSLIYTTSQEGLHELMMIDLESKQAFALLSGMQAGNIIDIEPNTGKILYSVKQDESNLWRVNVASGEDRKITSELGVEFWPDVSPNGEKVAFQAVKGAGNQVNPYKCSILIQPLSPDGQAVPLATSASQVQWSPDGKLLAFLQQEKGATNLYIVPAIGGQAKPLSEGGISISGFSLSPYNHLNDYSWSPDGSRLAYISKKEGLRNLWITAADGSGEVKVSNHTNDLLSMVHPLWSPDGKRIAYVTDDYKTPQNGNRNFTLWVAYPDNPGTSEAIFQTESYLKLVGWSDKDGLIVGLVDKKAGSTVDPCDGEIYVLNGTSSRKITSLNAAYFNNLHLSPDKKSIAFVALQVKKSNIYTYSLKGGETKQITRNADPTIFFSTLAWSPDGTFICYGRQERQLSFTIIEGLK